MARSIFARAVFRGAVHRASKKMPYSKNIFSAKKKFSSF